MSGLLRKPIKNIKEDDFAGLTLGGVILRGATVLAVVAVIVWAVGFALGWFSAATQVVSPANVRAQYVHAYTDFEALHESAGNVCGARRLEAQTVNDANALVQRQTQEATYEQAYRRIQADYDAAYDDAFRAKHVGPRDLPHRAPSLDEALRSIGCGL